MFDFSFIVYITLEAVWTMLFITLWSWISLWSISGHSLTIGGQQEVTQIIFRMLKNLHKALDLSKNVPHSCR